MCAGGQPEERGCRGFGSAVQALLRYLGSLGFGSDRATARADSAATKPLSLEGNRCFCQTGCLTLLVISILQSPIVTLVGCYHCMPGSSTASNLENLLQVRGAVDMCNMGSLMASQEAGC